MNPNMTKSFRSFLTFIVCLFLTVFYLFPSRSAVSRNSDVTVSSFDPQRKEINTVDLDSNTVKKAFEVGADTTVNISDRFFDNWLKENKQAILDEIQERTNMTRHATSLVPKEYQVSGAEIGGAISPKIKINEKIKISLDFYCAFSLYYNGKKIEWLPNDRIEEEIYGTKGLKVKRDIIFGWYVEILNEQDKEKMFKAFSDLVKEHFRLWSYKFKDFDGNEKEFLMLGFKLDGAMTDYHFWMFVPGQDEILKLRLPYSYLGDWGVRSPPGFLIDVGFTFSKWTDENKFENIEIVVLFAAKGEEKGKRADWGYAKSFLLTKGFQDPSIVGVKYGQK